MSQEYDYTKSGRNIYRRSPSPKPALVDHSKLFQEDVALWRKKEEIMEKEHAEDVAEHAFIAKAVVGSLADAKNIHKKSIILPSVEPATFELKNPNQNIKGSVI